MFIEPYIGTQYEDGFRDGLKLLVLGESHYWPTEGKELTAKERLRFTIDHFQSYQNSDYTEDKGRLGKQLNRILTGTSTPNKVEVSAFWRKLAFSNFVQQILPERGRPSAKQWHEANCMFPELLTNLKPEIVLVLGSENWKHIKLGKNIDFGCAESDERESFPGRRSARPLYRFDYPSGHAFATWAYHPSRPAETFLEAHKVFEWLMGCAVTRKRT